MILRSDADCCRQMEYKTVDENLKANVVENVSFSLLHPSILLSASHSRCMTEY